MGSDCPSSWSLHTCYFFKILALPTVMDLSVRSERPWQRGCTNNLGPVVQSIASLTTLLRGHLVKYIPTTISNTSCYFLLENVRIFCIAKILIFSYEKYQRICNIYILNFNVTLTYNDVVNFEQLAPDLIIDLTVCLSPSYMEDCSTERQVCLFNDNYSINGAFQYLEILTFGFVMHVSVFK